ncbi:peptide-methionine (S)-S-oxide reductase MsrA [Sphingomonas sp. GCM10030256]|uniref:peptide-methionine (S)-S-oxide reductase MsrA n=1 Tax=Sphingomonas sp. GCM10030256 TaxID=3273427 RepID=UPI00360CCC75
MRRFLIASGALILAACGSDAPAAAPQAGQRATAVFAGGCFWCTESDFDHMPGVLDTVSGYTGGTLRNPTYKQVSAGGTGHLEAVRVTYDPTRISYAELARRFLRTVDAVDGGGQFCDRSDQYRSAIFVATPAERAAATAAIRQASAQLKQKVATEILPARTFTAAEGYHQDYYRKNAVRYKFYRWNCGRDQRLKALWQR